MDHPNLEQQAREMLATEFEHAGMHASADTIRAGDYQPRSHHDACVRAIVAALSAPAVEVEPSGCNDPDCGCGTPTFTEPMEALRFLSGRFKYAGVGRAVAKSYARDIDAILAKHTSAAGAVPDSSAAVAAIQFALTTDHGFSFLRLWNMGEFDVIRRAWPEAPAEVFVGADPLAAATQDQESRNG
ncbi:MAG: hypothetical protein GX856_14000 [Gammaproteobacteria bacterium]|jgi:hypothetical protein|nr:hypothetical protein [Gammaproteobacteria bacterium]